MLRLLGTVPARVRTRATLELDLLRLRRRAARLGLRPSGSPRPTALIVSLTGYVYQLKLEGVFAAALRRKGLEPVAVVPAGNSIARRYFEAFGIERFVELDAYVDPAGAEEAAAEAARLIDGVRSVEDLKAVRFRGASVGVQVLSTVSRLLHLGSVDLRDEQARELVARLLPTAVRATLAAERLLAELDPALLLFNERNYAAEAPLSDIALERGVNVVQFVSAFRDDAFAFKRFTHETRRFHPRSLSDESWRRVRAMPWGEAEERALDHEFELRYGNTWELSRRIQGWTRPRARDELVAELGIDPAKPTAVVFSHVLWDANMFYGRDLFADQEEWFVETVRAAAANDRVNWIVKLHPANVWKRARDGVEGELADLAIIRQRVGRLPAHVKVLRPESDISTRSIFELADYGVTIRGSVGIELPCFGKAVLTAGTGYYSGRGFTVDSSTRDEYLQRLGEIERIPRPTAEQVELARRHAFALFRLRPLRFTSFTTTFRRQRGHPLEQDIVLHLDTPDQLDRAQDLRRFADWAVDSRELDYLDLADGGGGYDRPG